MNVWIIAIIYSIYFVLLYVSYKKAFLLPDESEMF